ncbi:MAG TPA: transglycosylase SLT domain-containing protein [Capsulimonadaceae bacterium]
MRHLPNYLRPLTVVVAIVVIVNASIAALKKDRLTRAHVAHSVVNAAPRRHATKSRESRPAIVRHRKSLRHKLPSTLRTAEIESVVLKHHPEKGKPYARRIASLLVENAHAAKLPVEVVVATAVVESGFSMKSGPCIGIMQIHPATYHELYEESGLNPHRLRDNIRLGTRELARHYRQVSSRSISDRRRLAIMWGRYNGAGPRSGYVRKALRTYDALRAR